MSNDIQSQNKAVFELLTSGQGITSKDVLKYGIMRLSARIYDLKKRGIPIITTIEHRGKKRFARYSLDTTKGE